MTDTDARAVLTPVLDTRASFWTEPIVSAYHFSILPGWVTCWDSRIGFE